MKKKQKPKRKRLRISAEMAAILHLPDDIDRNAMLRNPTTMERNPKFWDAEAEFIKGKECAYCDKPAEAAHHLFPFWLFPSLEMDERFWIPVCASKANHHLYGAHLGNYQRFDIFAFEHAAILKRCAQFSADFVEVVKEAEHHPELKKAVMRVLAVLAGREIKQTAKGKKKRRKK